MAAISSVQRIGWPVSASTLAAASRALRRLLAASVGGAAWVFRALAVLVDGGGWPVSVRSLAAASRQTLAFGRPRLFDVLGSVPAAGVSDAWGAGATRASGSGPLVAWAFPFALPWLPLWPLPASAALPT